MAWTEIKETEEATPEMEYSEKMCECLCEIKDVLWKILHALEHKPEPEVIAYNERKPMNV